jgi:ABC-type transporter Mla subunit MlaD
VSSSLLADLRARSGNIATLLCELSELLDTIAAHGIDLGRRSGDVRRAAAYAEQIVAAAVSTLASAAGMEATAE